SPFRAHCSRRPPNWSTEAAPHGGLDRSFFRCAAVAWCIGLMPDSRMTSAHPDFVRTADGLLVEADSSRALLRVPAHVGERGQTRQHLLIVSPSHFDPKLPFCGVMSKRTDNGEGTHERAGILEGRLDLPLFHRHRRCICR